MTVVCLKVEKHLAEKAKRELLKNSAMLKGYGAQGDENSVYFPVSKTLVLPFPHSYVRRKMALVARQSRPMKELLAGKLSQAELEELKSSYDIVGGVAILEIPAALRKKEKLIARALLESSSRIKTVARKSSAMLGEYRVRRLKWLAGAKTFSTIYKENGVAMKIALDKVYFSPRLSTERARIASLVRPKENVLVLFAGVGPFALVIAKKQPSAKVAAVELNPAAVKLMRENVALNKLRNVEVVEGDVREVLKRRFAGWASRIAMPLPHAGETFLKDALRAAAKGCTVHFYAMAPDDGLYSAALRAIRDSCKAAGRRCAIVRKAIVRPYAPRIFQVVVDFRVY